MKRLQKAQRTEMRDNNLRKSPVNAISGKARGKRDI
jgi:hypothetical protein